MARTPAHGTAQRQASSRWRATQTVEESGRFAVVRSSALRNVEDFAEPDPELIGIGDRLAENEQQSAERPAEQRPGLAEAALASTIRMLQEELLVARAEADAKQLELDELRKILLPMSAPMPHAAESPLRIQEPPCQLARAPLPPFPALASPPSLAATGASIARVIVRAEGNARDGGCPLLMAAEFNSHTELYADLTGDLQSGGVFVATYHGLSLGTPVELEVELSDGSVLRIAGVVRWLRDETTGESPPGVGIAFQELSEAAHGALRRSFSVLPPRYFEA